MTTKILTAQYDNTEQCQQFWKSLARVNAEATNVWPKSDGYPYSMLVKMPEILAEVKEGFVIWADGGDSFFVKAFEPPHGMLLFQGEKQCFPIVEFAREYPTPTTEWPYLNAGGWCGETSLALIFFRDYLHKYLIEQPGANVQHLFMLAYFEAQKAGLPVAIDDGCEYMQSIAFNDHGNDFSVEGTSIKNNKTGTYPSVFHGNGRTDMNWIYKTFNL